MSNLNESNPFEVLIEVRRAGIMRENISFTPPDHVVLADVDIHFFFQQACILWFEGTSLNFFHREHSHFIEVKS